MQKREAKFTLLFRHWLKANPMPSAAFELKQCGSCLPFDAVQEHQIDALQAAKSTLGLLYKGPDDSRGIKPVDLFYLRNSLAFVVIRFASLEFSIIDIDTFLLEKKRSKRKSLTMARAREISTITVSLRSLRIS